MNYSFNDNICSQVSSVGMVYLVSQNLIVMVCFPSASLGWRISQEDFMESTRRLVGRFEVACRLWTGNSEFLVLRTMLWNLQNYPKRSDYDLNGQNNSTTTGFILDKYGNEDTKWESTEMERRSGLLS